MSRPAGHEAGHDGGMIHAWDELARLAAGLDALVDMNMGSGMTLGEFDGFVAAVAVCPDTVALSRSRPSPGFRRRLGTAMQEPRVNGRGNDRGQRAM